jgi:hypothetical protein
VFRNAMKAELKRIFGVKSVRFEAADQENPEQDTLFVEVTDVKPRPYGKDRIACKVTGSLILYSQAERTTYGFFAKRIEQAASADARKYFFGREIDVQDSPAREQNLHEKQLPFTYLSDSQYDPDRGEITSLTTSIDMED